MAIFRAGKRIGNMDIRIGLPRDRSMERKKFTREGEEFLRRDMTIGTSTSTAIGRFISQINKGEGVARANRFLIRLYPPKDIFKVAVEGPEGPEGHKEVVKDSLINDDQMKRNVELMCTNIQLPHRDIASHNFVTYGPGRKMPYAYVYDSQISATFMGDKFLRQRAFFETWQKKMFNTNTHNLNYYDAYVGQMDIYQLGQYRESSKDGDYDDNYRMTYGVRLHEVYPETVGEIQYQSIADDMIPMDIPVKFAFRTWENLTLDAINAVGFGTSIPDMPNIKPAPNYGLIGGILSKMPPEMKRAAKTVIEKIRRDIPIGKGTGGRVFPPFVINK